MPGDGTGVALTVGLGIAGIVLGLLRWLAAKLIASTMQRIDGAVVELGKIVARVDAVEDRLDRHIADLPLHYQRRDDAIREYTIINVKLDRLYELMLRKDNV